MSIRYRISTANRRRYRPCPICVRLRIKGTCPPVLHVQRDGALVPVQWSCRMHGPFPWRVDGQGRGFNADGSPTS